MDCQLHVYHLAHLFSLRGTRLSARAPYIIRELADSKNVCAGQPALSGIIPVTEAFEANLGEARWKRLMAFSETDDDKQHASQVLLRFHTFARDGIHRAMTPWNKFRYQIRDYGQIMMSLIDDNNFHGVPANSPWKAGTPIHEPHKPATRTTST